jgi:hypothetical protein
VDLDYPACDWDDASTRDAGHPKKARRVVIFVETERGRRRDEEPYSCTVTIPDGGIAKGSAKITTLLG